MVYPTWDARGNEGMWLGAEGENFFRGGPTFTQIGGKSLVKGAIYRNINTSFWFYTFVLESRGKKGGYVSLGGIYILKIKTHTPSPN